jgi:hypothetical protein
MRPSSRVRRKLARPAPRSPRVLASGTLAPADPVPGGAGGDDDGGDLVAVVGPLAGDGGHRDQAGAVQAGVGDERLGAVDHPLVAVLGGPGGQGAGVRPAARLGEAERGQLLAGGQRAQPALVLLSGAVAPDRHGPEADRGLQGDGHRGVDPGQLLDGQAQGGVVGAHAADLLGERQPEQAHGGHLVEDHRVEPLVPVHRLGPGGDHLLGEGPDDLAELLLLGCQLEVHRCSLVGWNGMAGRLVSVPPCYPPSAGRGS